MKTSIVLFVVSIENSKALKCHAFLKKTVVSISCSKSENKDEKYLKKKNQLRYQRFSV